MNEQPPDQLSADPPVATGEAGKPTATGSPAGQEPIGASFEADAPLELPAEASAPELTAGDVPPKRQRGRPKGSVSRNKAAPAPKLTVEERIAPYAHLIGTLSTIQIAALAKVQPWQVDKFKAGQRAPEPATPTGGPPQSQSQPQPQPEEAEAGAESAAPSAVESEGSPRGEPGVRGSRVDAFRDLVGVLPDAEVAVRAGVSTSGVLQYRQRHGIPAAGRKGGALAREAASAAARARTPSKIEAFHHLVGVLSDGEVAAQAGVTANAVQMYRRKRGIPAAPSATGGLTPAPAARAEGGGPAAPSAAPSAATSAARSGRSSHRERVFGWRITLQTARGELVRYAVAPDAEAACVLADGLGEVARIERLGEALA